MQESQKDRVMKLYQYNQNCSGGYLIEDNKNGIGETVVIEAKTLDESWDRLQQIGYKVSGFFDFCNCCGERWGNPILLGKSKTDTIKKGAFVHYIDGTIKEW